MGNSIFRIVSNLLTGSAQSALLILDLKRILL